MASGPVVAGVIRGERARYQVFGKTVSKCRKLEEAGQPDGIHIAKETADLIAMAGLSSSVRARGIATNKKKKGDTYWLLPKSAVKQTGAVDRENHNNSISNFHNSNLHSFSHGMDFSQTQTPNSTPNSTRMSGSIRRTPILAPLMSEDSSNLYQVQGYSVYNDPIEQSLAHGMDYSSSQTPHAATGGRRLSDSCRRRLSDSCSQNLQRRTSLTRKRSSMHLVPEARQSQSTLEKVDRLVFWNSETLQQVLRHISARRSATGRRRFFKSEMLEAETKLSSDDKPILQEVEEPIPIPTSHVDFTSTDSSAYDLPAKVEEQLFDYVKTISTLYPCANPYSNFEHASHTTMHMQKLLSRLDVSTLGYHGIANDPLIQFAMILSALVGAIDHNGKGASGQNSFMMAWELLMDSDYKDLRRSIYTDEEELGLLRSVLIHCPRDGF